MSARSDVSFLVLSYNNARFLPATLDSILAQTVSDFEVVIVDDASTDDSLSVIRRYDDPRIRLVVHERNRGLTPSYNEAVSLCSGEFIVNLDSDDAMTPDRTEKQLAVFAREPGLSVVGTHIHLIDENGTPHADAPLIEGIINRPHDFNDLRSWIVQNHVVRSSTMMRRTLHESVGPNEIGMVRAPDYDLWVRALRAGHRFHLINEPLTLYRRHSAGLTYGDPKATFLELSYSLARHVLPMIKDGDSGLLVEALEWVAVNESFQKMQVSQQGVVLGALMRPDSVGSYASFLEAVDRAEGGPVNYTGWVATGFLQSVASRLQVEASREAEWARGVAYEQEQAAAWRREYEYEKAQSAAWRREHEVEREEADKWREAFEAERRLPPWRRLMRR